MENNKTGAGAQWFEAGDVVMLYSCLTRIIYFSDAYTLLDFSSTAHSLVDLFALIIIVICLLSKMERRALPSSSTAGLCPAVLLTLQVEEEPLQHMIIYLELSVFKELIDSCPKKMTDKLICCLIVADRRTQSLLQLLLLLQLCIFIMQCPTG